MRIFLPGTVLFLLALAACGPDKEQGGSGGSSSSTAGSGGGDASSSSSGTGGSGASGGSGGSGGGMAVDCTDASQNPVVGTCYATFTACFAPKGTCKSESLPMGSVGFAYSWEDGTRFTLIFDAAKPNTSNVTILGAGGTPCLDGTVEDLTKMGGDLTGTLHDGKNPASTLTLVGHPDDSIDITCPDGTSFNIPKSKHDGFAACDPLNEPLKQCP